MSEDRLTNIDDGSVRAFDPDQLSGIPEVARRYLSSSIAPGTPLWTSAQVKMDGRIKIGRWLPFKATEDLDPHAGFRWRARVGGVISGFDQYIDGRGSMRWRLGGVMDLVVADGPDVSKSAVVRGAAESVWIPSSLHPVNGVAWSEGGEAAVARLTVGEHEIELSFDIDDAGRVNSVVTSRWGDPGDSGDWDLYPFGARFDDWAEFAGLTIPVSGSVGWFFGTPRWSEGEFFHFRIKEMVPG